MKTIKKITILSTLGIVFFTFQANAQTHKSYISSGNTGLPSNSTAFLFSDINTGYSTYKNPAMAVFNNKPGISKNIKEENININNITDAVSLENICMFPNQTDDELWVQLDSKSSSINELNVEIYNASGERVYNAAIEENLHKINLCDFTAGTFLVKLGDSVQKMVIE